MCHIYDQLKELQAENTKHKIIFALWLTGLTRLLANNFVHNLKEIRLHFTSKRLKSAMNTILTRLIY